MFSKNLCALLFAALLLASCDDPKKVKYDWDANHFYADYVKLYDNYGRVPYDSTKLALQTFLQQFPNDAKAWAFYGKVLLERDSLNAATAAYLKCLSLDKKMAWAYSGLAAIANRQHQFAAADSLLRMALELGDSSLASSLNLAIANWQLKNDVELRKFIDFIATHDTLADYFKENLVVLYTEMKDQKSAEKWKSMLSQKDSLLELYLAGKQTALQFLEAKRHGYDGQK